MSRYRTTRAGQSSVARGHWIIVALALTSVSCDSLTDVDAPDVVQPDQLANAQGAEALTNGALASLFSPFATFVYNTGLFSDEFTFAIPLIQQHDLDFRTQSLTFTESGPILMHRTRTFASLAIQARQQHAPNPRSRTGQLFALKGWVETFLGETSCSGTPLSEVERDFQPVYGGPISTDSMLKRAVADFDSAAAYAADSARILNTVRIGRGRALLNLGRYGDAAAAVTGVPTDHVFNAEYTEAVPNQTNTIWMQNSNAVITVSDREGTNGVNFRSANDPRVPSQFLRQGTDGITPVHVFSRFSSLSSPIPMATGIEARLIEAEAALQANRDDSAPTGSGWLGILNNLRATAVTPALPALADPGDFNSRVDLLFRERAFWLYATGHRMGDLRRLLRQYGRTQEQIYPVGPYKAGVNYGTDIVFILTLSEQSNPNGRECTDTNP